MAQEIIIKPSGEMLESQFGEIVSLIRDNRNRVFHYANTVLMETYWHVGRYISEKIAASAWGDGVVKQLAAYIARTAPELKGFDAKNLWRMRQLYDTYSGDEKLVTLSRQLSWSNNTLIMRRCETMEEKAFYLMLTNRDKLSYRELDRQINSSLYERTMLSQEKVSTVLRQIAPKAQEVFKDTYVVEFLTGEELKPENTLRRALIRHMKKFILELGKDFLFVGEEFRVQVGMSDFRIDLVFFHRELQCLVAFELKTKKFQPAFLGQLEFYLEALDRDVKKTNENPSIGVLLCQDKDDEVVEYALARTLSPTLVAKYQTALPDKRILQAKLRELYEAEQQLLEAAEDEQQDSQND